MAIIYLMSVSGAPGVSTLATALTVNWPRPALLLEADTSKTSHLLGGYLGARFKHDRGLTAAALANLRGGLTGEVLYQQTNGELGEGKYAIPGFSDLGGAHGSTYSFWTSMVRALDELPATVNAPDLDIIVDAGRFTTGDNRAPLMARADAVTLVTGNTLPDFNAVTAAITPIVQLLDTAGHRDYLSLVVQKSPHGGIKGPTLFGENEIRSYLGSKKDVRLGRDAIATLPWDAEGAAQYSHGAGAPSRKSKYRAAVIELATALERTTTDRRFTPGEEH